MSNPLLALRHEIDRIDNAMHALLVERGALLEYNTGSWRLPHPVIRLLSAYRRAEAMQPAEE